ncbi:SDR family NAD(P)-dependent oxidoreductase [Pendulispora albinea]|uniref:SDR family oxidoreductase n=1 Tax=Pendulispora albinea TaxID=2741071 RepID=A0ABZ2LRL2_9BACT
MGWIARTSSTLTLAALRAIRWRGNAGSSRYDFRDKVVVITGGSRGLGVEMARIWAAEGAKVAFCARDEQSVRRAEEELRRAGHEAMGYACDVGRQLDLDQFMRAVVHQWGGIDVLVNNAGVIQTGPAKCMTLSDFRTAMDTHFWGPLYAIFAALPAMRSRGGGRIVNISSIGGLVSVPHLLPYSATKFALTGLSTGLRTELAREGIAVTTVFPGLMRTGSPRNAWFKGQHRAEYAWFSISDSLPGITLNARRAARKIVEGCRRGDARLVLGLPAKLLAKVHGLFPAITAGLLTQVNRLLPEPGGVGTQAIRGADSASRWSPSWLTALSQRAEVRNYES